MLNIKSVLDNRKKIIFFLLLILVGLTGLGVSLIPVMNYKTGENMSERTEFIIPIVYIVIYGIIIVSIIVSIIVLSLISSKLYIVRKIDESIKGIKKGRYLEANTVPGRDALLQADFAEKMHTSGLKVVPKISIFDGMTQLEKDTILSFKIDKEVNNNSSNSLGEVGSGL
ncbi:MAG: hypothetical protein ACTSWN_07395 [Promethearchaeota archaeon]